MPKRSDVEDYFEQLQPAARPHIEALRQLSRAVAPEAREELKWNLPVYVRGKNTNLWMLQNFKTHCSVRFSTDFFADHRSTVEAAGYAAGAGFIKLPYTSDLPIELVTALMRARLNQPEPDDAAG